MAVLVISQNGQAVFDNIRSFAQISKEFVAKYGSIKEIITNYTPHNAGACPECGSNLVMEEGCKKCLSCGFSACG